jgi:isoleucyl-tRNA synthetase
VATHGADILRLWVAAEDYRDDVRISREIIERAVEAYRRVRNTARFLLGNLGDFDPRRDAVPADALLELDRFVLDRLQGLIERCRRAYDDFEFHTVYHGLNNFCSVDLSALYLDMVKDRLYCEGATSPERRSAQTALYRLLDTLVRLMAPILSFTAEDIWGHMATDPSRPASVLLADFPTVDPALSDPGLGRDWERLLEARGAVTKVLEGLRQRGVIGHSLEARVALAAGGALAELLVGRRALLPEIFIVSRVELLPEGTLAQPSTVEGLAVAAERVGGEKCVRCWNYRADVGQERRFPGLCARCARVLAATDVPAVS